MGCWNDNSKRCWKCRNVYEKNIEPVMKDQIGIERTGLGYGFTPPAGKRQIPQERKDRLDEIFGYWLDMIPFDKIAEEHGDVMTEIDTDFQKCVYGVILQVPGINEMLPEEGDILIAKHKTHKNIRYSGIFLTAFYNAIDAKNIEFDAEADDLIDYVGFGLRSGKTLVLRSDTGENTGSCSKGAIVNHAKSKILGDSAECDIINYGESETAARGFKGRFLNYGQIKEFGKTKEGVVVNFGHVDKFDEDEDAGTGILINMETCGSFPGVGVDIAINFGEAEDFDCFRDGLFINSGTVKIKQLTQGDSMVCLDLSKREHAEIKQYIDDLKKKIESYKTAQYPACLGVFDLVYQEIGSKEKLENKLGIIRPPKESRVINTW